MFQKAGEGAGDAVGDEGEGAAGVGEDDFAVVGV